MAEFSVENLTDILNKLDSQRQQVIVQLEKMQKLDNHYFLKGGPTQTYLWNMPTPEEIQSRITHVDEHNIEFMEYVSEEEYKLQTIVDTLKTKYRPYLNYKKRYQLVTLTFDPSISKGKTMNEQRHALERIIRKFDEHQYFACFEKHVNDILHAHMLIVYDPIDLITVLNKYKSNVTPRRKLMPAINIKQVHQSELHINQTYNYIFENKKNHPLHKDLILNP